MERIEGEVQQFMTREADAQMLGLVKLIDVETVTDSRGYALSAKQNNAAIPGTLANRVMAARSLVDQLKNEVQQVQEQLPVKKGARYKNVVAAFPVSDFLETASVPAPVTSYGVTVYTIDIYGLRVLSDVERSKFRVSMNTGSFSLATNDRALVQEASGRALVVEYMFV